MDRLLALWHDYNALNKAQTLLYWDQAVMMPAGGSAARGEHLARLARLAHEKLTSDEMRAAAEALLAESAPDSVEAANARAVLREIALVAAIPVELVSREKKASAAAYEVWKRARAENNFAPYAPYLAENVEIQKEIAEARGYEHHIYDALTDKFEEGATFAFWESMFAALGPGLVEILREVRARGVTDDSALDGAFSPEVLRTWAQGTLAQVGFDFTRGRLDLCGNAFATNLSSSDVRMTTRSKSHLGGVVFSSMHEMGHALYEQNMPPEWDRHPVNGGVSLGIHESQSRFWENVIGRSPSFWRWALPSLNAALGTQFEMPWFYHAINRVEPGPIRIGSDELSYNLHILVRFRLEVELLTGRLAVSDLPGAWNEAYQTHLGVTPANDSEGCLQDVHWSKGSFGYFPTYALGNLLSWQLWERMSTEFPTIEAQMEQGDFSTPLRFLCDEIYRHGKRFAPTTLAEKASHAKYGDPAAYLRCMRAKYLSDA